MDPSKPSTCVLALGHHNLLWRFDHLTGEVGCGTTKAATPPIDQLYCNGAPDPSKFKWTGFTVSTAGAAGTLTVKQGTVTVYSGPVSSSATIFTTSAFGATPLTASFTPAGGSPSSIDVNFTYTSDKNPEICYQAKVSECGPVFNDAVFKASLNGAAINVAQKVDLGVAKGPECDPVPPPPVVTCLSGDAKVTCGKVPGTYVITFNTTGAGGATPTSVSITPMTAGVTIVNPQASYPVIDGQVKFIVAGANPGDTLSFDLEGTKVGAGAVEGSDLCCNGTVKVEIPKDLPCEKPTISIVKTGPKTCEPGKPCTFNVTVTNNGAPFNGNVLLWDQVSPNAWPVTAITPNVCGAAVSTTPFGCVANLNLAAGQSMSFAVTMTSSFDETLENENCIGVALAPAWLTPNTVYSKAQLATLFATHGKPKVESQSCWKVTKGGDSKFDVAVKKTGATSPAANAAGYTFKLDMTNEGQAFTPAANALTVTDTVPAGMTFNSVTGSAGWTCAPNANVAAGGLVTCTYAGGALPAGPASPVGSINIVATASGTAPFQPVSNCSDANLNPASGSADTNASNNHSCATVTKPPVGDGYDISLKKSWTKGATALDGSFTLKVKNEGPSGVTSASPVKVVDHVPAGVTISGIASSSTANWTCSPATVTGAGNITCTYTGAMPVAPGVVLPDLQLNATLAAPVPPKTVPIIYNNCADALLASDGTSPIGEVTETNLANNQACAPTETITANCIMDHSCPPPPELTCKSDVLLVVDRSASIVDAVSLNSAITNFVAPMKNKGGKLEVLYFASKNFPFSTPTETVLAQTPMGAPGIPGLAPASGGYTNWDNALRETSNKTTTPKFVLFITDGEPTAYDDSSNNEVASLSNPTLAANEAAPWINAIRMGGSKLLAVGFGPVATQGYLDATFGGTVGNSLSADVIKVANEGALYALMTKLGRQMCGTLNLSKSSAANIFDVIPKTASSKVVTGDLKYNLQITNNSAAAINSVVVEDVFAPVIQTGMPSDAAFGPPVVSGTPSAGVATVSGTALSWAIPSLAPGATETMQFKSAYSGTHSDTADKSWWVPNYAQVKSALTDTFSTSGNLGGYVNGPVLEPDEASASANIYVQKQKDVIVNPNPCDTPSTAPAYCFLGAEKKRVVAEGTCSAGQNCKYEFKVVINSMAGTTSAPGIPAGATVSIMDVLTDDGVNTAWPANVTMTSAPTGVTCNPGPTTAGFTCSVPYPATGTTVLTFTADVAIPAGTSGLIKNCIGAKIANAGSPYDNLAATPGQYGLNTGQLCAQHNIASGQKTVASTGSLTVEKIALFNEARLTGIEFPVRVKCGDVISDLRIRDGAPQRLDGLPVDTLCEVSEGIIPVTALCGGQAEPVWTTTYQPEAPVAISLADTKVTVTNTLACKPIEIKDPIVCDPATATKAGDLCRCRFDNMSPVSKTACDCKPGFTLKAGQGCVRKVVEPKCDPATTVTKGGKCLCEYKNMVQTSATACACAKGLKFAPGKGCYKPEPVCRKGERYQPARGRCEPVCAKGFDYSPKRNACIQQKPDCPQGAVYNPKRNRCDPVQPVCRKPFVYDAKRNACVEQIRRCEPGTIPFRGRCIPVPKCPRGQIPIPGTPLCVAIGGGGGDGPKGGGGGDGPKGGGCIPTAARACD